MKHYLNNRVDQALLPKDKIEQAYKTLQLKMFYAYLSLLHTTYKEKK